MTVTGSKAPDKNTLVRYRDEGLTQQQMADRWTTESGWNITRSAIAMALKREGVPPVRPRPRYEDELPWKVAQRHIQKSDAQYLRFWARRRHGKSLQPEEESKLNHWLGQLLDQDAVIVYDRETPEGFHWIPRTALAAAKENRLKWVDPLERD